MAPSKSTTAQGREHEEFIVDLFKWNNAQRSKSSGASFHDPIDVTSDSLVIECESTENASYRLKEEFWGEVLEKGYNGKWPALAIRFRDKLMPRHTELMIMSAHDLSEILEELEAYRTEALARDDHKRPKRAIR